MKVLKTIYKESSKLQSFNLVDEEAEWRMFLDKTSPELSDLQILYHLDGLSNYSDKKAVEDWVSKSPENQKDLEVFNLILAEAPHLTTYKSSNADFEWNSFKTQSAGKSSVKTSVTTTTAETPITTTAAATSTVATPITATATTTAPVIALENSKETSSRKFVFPLWQKMAVAAALAILLMSVWFMRPQDPYAEYATQDFTHTIEMSDGSTIEMAEYTTLRYPKKLKKLDERRLFISGQGTFDVAENKEKPFIVEVNDRIGVEVLGTVFRVKDDDEYVEVVENLEGTVRAFVLDQPETDVTLMQGDKFGYDGLAFVDMNYVPEEPDNAKEYLILDVVDYLMETSGWKIITSPYRDFEEEGIVKVDLDQPIGDILEDLKERGDFEYEALSCDGCFIITKFRTLKF